MWIDRKVYDDLRLTNAKLQEESRILNQRITAQDTTFDWCRVRITQLEMERAQMLFNYTGIKVPTPVIHREPEGFKNPMGQIPNFNDMGDDAAKQEGVDWDENGNLVYRVPTKQ